MDRNLCFVAARAHIGYFLFLCVIYAFLLESQVARGADLFDIQQVITNAAARASKEANTKSANETNDPAELQKKLERMVTALKTGPEHGTGPAGKNEFGYHESIAFFRTHDMPELLAVGLTSPILDVQFDCAFTLDGMVEKTARNRLPFVSYMILDYLDRTEKLIDEHGKVIMRRGEENVILGRTSLFCRNAMRKIMHRFFIEPTVEIDPLELRDKAEIEKRAKE